MNFNSINKNLTESKASFSENLHPKLGVPMKEYEALKQIIIKENNFVTQEQLEEQKLYMQ